MTPTVTSVIKSFFFNSSNPASDPDQYIDYLAQLLDTVVKQQQKLKLIINTCGWIEGLGAHILHEFLKHFNKASTNIVRLSSVKD